MTLHYTTNSWRHGYYVLLEHFDQDDIYNLTGDDIDFLKSIGYNMVFEPCF